MSRRPRWKSLSGFEREFWTEADRIRVEDRKAATLGPDYAQQHPSHEKGHPGPKHTNEWLPLLILLKHEAERRENWPISVEVAISDGADAKTENGLEMDAAYRFTDRILCVHETRKGHLEVVRSISEEDSRKLEARNRQISRAGAVSLGPGDLDGDLPEMRRDALDAIANKVENFRKGAYEPNTVLVVWLRDEKNPGYGRFVFDEEGFRRDVAAATAGAFERVCVVGVTCGIVWVKGDGL